MSSEAFVGTYEGYWSLSTAGDDAPTPPQGTDRVLAQFSADGSVIWVTSNQLNTTSPVLSTATSLGSWSRLGDAVYVRLVSMGQSFGSTSDNQMTKTALKILLDPDTGGFAHVDGGTGDSAAGTGCRRIFRYFANDGGAAQAVLNASAEQSVVTLHWLYQHQAITDNDPDCSDYLL